MPDAAPESAHLPDVIGTGSYLARVTPLKTGGRRDVEVIDPLPVESFATDIVGRLRQFFDAIEQEAQEHKGDPVALTHALARLEALMADVRYIRDVARKLTADALHAEKVRRLTVSGVATVEGLTEVTRTEWQHERLLTAMLEHWGVRFISDNGEVIPYDVAAARILEWLRPEWKLTPIREADLDPDRYCTISKDEEGKYIRTPTVKMVDNLVRRIGGAPT